MKGYIHSTESFGSVDGPGIRFVIFLKGCAMRCAYCHNPDTWARGTQADLKEAADLLNQAERYRAYWGEEGGITVSGGEALLQMDFCTDLFTQARERGIGTCLDTSAQCFTRQKPWIDRFDALLQVTDTILLDIKHTDSAEHLKLTGMPNGHILDCARYLSEKNIPVWIRQVQIPTITQTEQQLEQLHRFVATLNNVKKVELLPYHTMGLYKWKELGMEYPLKHLNEG
ncbi:MAG: pyruvate formate-lyase-activating protein [Prevotella sp.]